MAFTFGFYNSMRGDRKYNADQVGALFDGLLNDGVYASIGEIFATVPGEGMSVVVKTGRAWFNRTWNENNSHMILTLSESNVLLPRFDAVVLEVDKRDNVRQNRILIVEGTPSANPVHPNLINNAEVGFFQHPLAYVKVDPNVITIAPDKIQIMVGTNECPFVTGILRLSSIDDLYQGWEYQFQEWWKGIKALLNENTVGRLQAQIDERVKYTDKVDVNNLSQILSDENNRWMTPASTKKAILNLANPIGSTALPGQQPSGVGSWAEYNGLYVQNMPENAVKALFKKKYGYFSNFYVYMNAGRPLCKAYDRKNGNEAILASAGDSGGRVLYLSNVNSGSLTVDTSIGQTDIDIGYLDGMLATLNPNGTLFFGNRSASLFSGSATSYGNFAPDNNRLVFYLEYPNNAYYDPVREFVTVSSNGVILNRTSLPLFDVVENSNTYHRSTGTSVFVPIRLENGHICAFTPSMREYVNGGNSADTYVYFSIFDTTTYGLSEVHINNTSGVTRLVCEALSKINEKYSSTFTVCPSTDYNSAFIGSKIVTNKNGGLSLSGYPYQSDQGRHMMAHRGGSTGAPNIRAVYMDISMGLAETLPPRGLLSGYTPGYSGLEGLWVACGNLYGSGHRDGSFGMIDADPNTGNIPTSGGYGTSLITKYRDSTPTMLTWATYGRSSSSNPYVTTLRIVLDDPSKVRVPYDPTGSVFRYA